MKKIFLMTSLIVTGAVALGAPAFAQDWSGPYVGAALTSGMPVEHDRSLQFDTNRDGGYGDTVHNFMGTDIFAPGFCKGLPRGTTAASGCSKQQNRFGLDGRVGYDWQTGNWVYGVVGDYNSAVFHDSVTGFSSEPNIYSFTRRVSGIGAIRARLGYSMNHWLIYGTAGAATASIDHGFVTSNTLNSFTAAPSHGKNGFQGGFGIEKKYGANWSVGLEYLYTSIADRGGAILVGPTQQTSGSNPFVLANASGTSMRRSDDKFQLNTVLLTVNYRFGGWH